MADERPKDYVIDEDSDTRCREVRHVCQVCGRECAADDSECSCGGMITDVPVPDSEAEDYDQEEDPEDEDLNWYTVVGLYPDYQDEPESVRSRSFCQAVQAECPSEAGKVAIGEMIASVGHFEEDDDWQIIAVFEGKHEDALS